MNQNPSWPAEKFSTGASAAELSAMLDRVLAEQEDSATEDVLVLGDEHLLNAPPPEHPAPLTERAPQPGSEHDDGMGVLTQVRALLADMSPPEGRDEASSALLGEDFPPRHSYAGAQSGQNPLCGASVSELSAMLDDALAEPEDSEAEDVLILGDEFLLGDTPPEQPAPLTEHTAQPGSAHDDGMGALSQVRALLADMNPPDSGHDADESARSQIDALVADMAEPLDDKAAAPLPPTEERSPSPQSLLAAQIEEILAVHHPHGPEGDPNPPNPHDSLAGLLSAPPPTSDFAALDLLGACWPKGTHKCHSRALLAVAWNLSATFGTPHRLPMAMTRAWRLLDPDLFHADLARQLQSIKLFIVEWQKRQGNLLILEHGEIELIEYLFEALPPQKYGELLADVMRYKVLSARRQGLLRRIPNRVRRLIQGRDDAPEQIEHFRELLRRITSPEFFTPIVETAQKSLLELDKMAAQALGKKG